jgi:hypothetical protein
MLTGSKAPGSAADPSKAENGNYYQGPFIFKGLPVFIHGFGKEGAE